MALHAKSLASGVSQLIRKVALAADQAAVLATPVDTGRARANWILSIGSPSAEIVEPVASGTEGSGARGSANAQRALDQAASTLSTRPAGASVTIVNNVEYITFLNDGTSKQAPHGMLPAALAAAQAVVRSAKVLSRSKSGGGGGPARDPATGRFLKKG